MMWYVLSQPVTSVAAGVHPSSTLGAISGALLVHALPETLFRFILRAGRLYPGGIDPADPRLNGKTLLIHAQRYLGTDALRLLSATHPNAVLDIAGGQEGDVVDAVMLGMRRVTVNGWGDASHVKMAHALCPTVLTRFDLREDARPLFDRLWGLKDEIQPPILLVETAKGRIAGFLDRHGAELSDHFTWHLAPFDGMIDESIPSVSLAGWCISPEMLLTNSVR